jgi:hypothetical protein
MDSGENDITKLNVCSSRTEIKAAEEIAKRTPCLDFDKFKSLFSRFRKNWHPVARITRKFKDDAQIRLGIFSSSAVRKSMLQKWEWNS